NYACHPTTLGGANRLISPDYIGAMRELIEEATGKAPCLFLQGASGELGPRRGYEQDPLVADRNGRQLGHAVLSALTGMLPHRQMLRFSHAQDSGAMLGIWSLADHEPSGAFHALHASFGIPLRRDLPTVDQLAEQLASCQDRAERERLERLNQQLRPLGDDSHFTMPLWGWRLGDSLVIGSPAEAYSLLQIELRKQFPKRAVAVLNLVNGYVGYLPPKGLFAKKTYQVNISLFNEGCLEQTLHECGHLARRLEQDNRP
ncbi:MAG: alkaline ceramidase, partial [Pirellulales bacterium]|nr:alkaline ceramidase [Pirellulales bacterium]